MIAGLTRQPGTGPGWTRVASELAALVSPSEIDSIWLLTPIRNDGREWGVAVICRQLEGDRKRIYTASYMLLTRGRQRGQAKVSVTEVGDTPDTVLQDVLRGVQDRAGDSEPAEEIPVTVWYPPTPDPADEDPTDSDGTPKESRTEELDT